MKYLYKFRITVIAILLVLFSMTGCNEEYLKPLPLSFFTPEVLTSVQALDGLLIRSRAAMRNEMIQNNTPWRAEYWTGDTHVYGQPTGGPKNFTIQWTPTATQNIDLWYYWNLSYSLFKEINTVISNIDDVQGGTQEAKDGVKAGAYFHRAYWYYRLIMQFGDVPAYEGAITSVKLDFQTVSRDAIIAWLIKDLEWAVQKLPVNALAGRESQGAGYQLLTKLYLAAGNFDGAIQAASKLIDGGKYKLMTAPFGTTNPPKDPRFKGAPAYDVIWMLHQRENKSIAANTEAILVNLDANIVEGGTSSGGFSNGTMLARNWGAQWWANSVTKDPDGLAACVYVGDQWSFLGRGIGWTRGNNHFNYEIWTDKTDLRHNDLNWWGMEDYTITNPASKYLGQPIRKQDCTDTIIGLYPFMANKLVVKDDINLVQPQGGISDLYIYRLAETYLLRAEAYFYKGDLVKAATDINAVRGRAKARLIAPGEVTIDFIMDERSRELFLEEPRKCELTRVSYILADQKMMGYSRSNLTTKNYYYDRKMAVCNFYRGDVLYGDYNYRLSPYNILWPIPQSSILANVNGHINQNPGYSGSETNVAPLTEVPVIK